MTPQLQEALQVALRLPNEDRLHLAEALFESVGPADSPPFDEWIAEAKRRAARIDAGEGRLSSWEEVRDRGRVILTGARGM